jgi:catechol 2,3-dioxygenase-like lactoylglutathione lyase family enzyme
MRSIAINIPVQRIIGLNLRVSELNRSLSFFRDILGLEIKGAFGREAFLHWKPDGEDFVGLFARQSPGWHHVELRLHGADAQMALAYLDSRNLLASLRSVGSRDLSQKVLRSYVPPEVEIFTPLTTAPLVAELPDPDGRSLELVFLPEEYAEIEVPGLLAIEVESSRPDVVNAFYSQLGLLSTSQGLCCASGQRLVVHQGDRLSWVRATIAVPSDAIVRLQDRATTLQEGVVKIEDPDGHEFVLVGYPAGE